MKVAALIVILRDLIFCFCLSIVILSKKEAAEIISSGKFGTGELHQKGKSKRDDPKLEKQGSRKQSTPNATEQLEQEKENTAEKDSSGSDTDSSTDSETRKTAMKIARELEEWFCRGTNNLNEQMIKYSY